MSSTKTIPGISVKLQSSSQQRHQQARENMVTLAAFDHKLLHTSEIKVTDILTAQGTKGQ